MEKNINAQRLDTEATLREIFFIIIIYLFKAHNNPFVLVKERWNPAFNVRWKLKQVADAWKSPLRTDPRQIACREWWTKYYSN